MSDAARDSTIEAELSAGNMPEFLRHFRPVHLRAATSGAATEITICAAPDYLAVGSDHDFLFVPMRLATALRIAARFGATLPTPKIVDAIYEEADVHLQPQPLPASDEMRSTEYYVRHNELVRRQESAFGVTQGELVAGDKKDLVIANRLWEMLDRVAIYGWHRAPRAPIQPLSTLHGARYADYSHGVRLIGADAYVDGRQKPLMAVLKDPQLAQVVSHEGPIAHVEALLAKLSMPPPEHAQNNVQPGP